MKICKRITAMLLSLLLCCAMVPVTVFAADEEMPYGISSEDNSVASASVISDTSVLSSMEEQAEFLNYGIKIGQSPGSYSYGNSLSPFSLEGNSSIVNFTMDYPINADDFAALVGANVFKIGVQDASAANAPIMFYPVIIQENARDKTLSVCIPVGENGVNCAIYQCFPSEPITENQNRPSKITNQSAEIDSEQSKGNQLSYKWSFVIEEGESHGNNNKPKPPALTGGNSSKVTALVQLQLPGLDVTDDSFSVDSQFFQITKAEELSDGYWQLTLTEKDGFTDENGKYTESAGDALASAITVSVAATLDSETFSKGGSVVLGAQIILWNYNSLVIDESKIHEKISDVAPLVQQRVIGINYVDVDTKDAVDSSAALAGMDDTTISVDDLTAPEGYELAVDGTTVTIEDNVATVPVREKVFTITTVVGPNGSIAPQGPVKVKAGEDRTFTFKPNSGYEVNTVLVDGNPVTITGNTYTFTNVNADHAIVVTFEKKSSPPIIVVPPDDDDEDPDQPADPDDTGVSDLLNTKDHDQYLFGYPDGTFGPGLNMTRAEAAQMFYNLLVDQNVTAKPVFDDVPEGAWYAEAVNVMAKLDIVEGVGDNKFEPNREITRAEFTAMAMRFAEGETGGKNIFSDVDEDDWFYEVVVDSIKYGWIEGYPDGTFRPANLITREEVTTIVNRMLGRLPDEKFIDAHEDDLDLFPDVTKNWAYYDVVEATNDHDYTKSSSGEDWTKLG